MPPKVRVVVPNYNYARFLDERITSLLNQAFQDFELIIVDDGSTDDSRAVIEKYRGHDKVRTLFFDTNSGCTYKRWNDGAALATGEYLLFAGADDSCEPTMLEALVAALDKNPRVGVAYCRSWSTDAFGRKLRKKPWGERFDADYVARGADEIVELLDGGSVLTASAALIRRTVFQQVGGFDEALQLYADSLFWARVLLVSDLAYLAEPLNHFRSHGSNVGATTPEGLAIYERYQVFRFVLASFDVSTEVKERACDGLIRRWATYLALTRHRTDISLLWRTYLIALQTDPRFHRRLFKLALRGVRRTTRRALHETT